MFELSNLSSNRVLLILIIVWPKRLSNARQKTIHYTMYKGKYNLQRYHRAFDYTQYWHSLRARWFIFKEIRFLIRRMRCVPPGKSLTLILVRDRTSVSSFVLIWTWRARCIYTSTDQFSEETVVKHLAACTEAEPVKLVRTRQISVEFVKGCVSKHVVHNGQNTTPKVKKYITIILTMGAYVDSPLKGSLNLLNVYFKAAWMSYYINAFN